MSTTTAARPRRVRPPAPRRRSALWRDPAGKFSWLKAATLLLVILPGLGTAVGLATGTLGARPITEAIHETGHWAVRFILITLAVSPARVILDWPRIVLLRRMLGVTAACYACAHFTLYNVDQNWNFGVVASEIVLRFYLTIGFVTLLGLIALAVTSTDSAMRRMGQRWKQLHRIIFALTVLALFHYYMQSKADVSAAVFVTGFYIWELLWRAVPKRVRGRLWLLPLLAIGAAIGTALVEAAWYGTATRIDPVRVLAANLDLDYPTMAVDVLMVGFAVFAAVAIRRLVTWLRRARASKPLKPALPTS